MLNGNKERLEVISGDGKEIHKEYVNLEEINDEYFSVDSGAKKVLLPQTSAVDFGTAPAELMSVLVWCSIRVQRMLCLKR